MANFVQAGKMDELKDGNHKILSPPKGKKIIRGGQDV